MRRSRFFRLKAEATVVFLVILGVASAARAEDGYELWLRYHRVADAALLKQYRGAVTGLLVSGESPTARAVSAELSRGLNGLLGAEIARLKDVTGDGAVIAGTGRSPAVSSMGLEADLRTLAGEGYIIRSVRARGRRATVIAANTDVGVLYGAFHFLRADYEPQARQQPGISSTPNGMEAYRLSIRMHTTVTPTPEEVHEFGLNYRLPDVLCALGSSQLRRLAHFKARHAEIHARYTAALSDVDGVRTPVTLPGADPMCLDAGGMAWAQAWISKQEPPKDKIGFGYMLAGGSDASNQDPFATEPATGADWVDTGPHVMIFNAGEAVNDYPGQADNLDTKAPYVMWAGTPYEHLMIPVR